MGTRNLTIIHASNSYPVAKYCQWDGYPEGQGHALLSILRTADFDSLRSKALACKKSDEEHFKTALQESCGNPSGMLSLDESQRFKDAFPELHRDTGAEIVRMILESDAPLTIPHEFDFAADSLFCEWAYVVDLDSMRFEVFKGFNTQPLGPDDRFAFLESEIDTKPNHSGETYHPVWLVHSFDLNDLPSDEDFISILVNGDEEDE